MENKEILQEAVVDELRLRFALYEPYEKQAMFHNLGSTVRERILSAGNQTGKTMSASHETAFHLTGKYPDWWQGKIWNRPVRGWASGVSSESTRDVIQKKLFVNEERY